MTRIASANPKWPEIEGALLRRKPTLKRASLEQYEFAARNLARVTPSRLSQDQLDQIREAIVAKYHRNSVRTLLTCVRSILRNVYGRRVTGRLEFCTRGTLLLAVPRYRKRVDAVFSRAQAVAMERVVAERKSSLVKAVYYLIYDGTLRIGEVCALNVNDIDVEARHVLVRDGKGDDRRVMITAEAAEALRDWYRDRPDFQDDRGAAAFVTSRRNQNRASRKMRRITRKFMTWHLRNIGERAKAPRRASPHLMRATGATHMLNTRGNPEMVRINMGHKSIETTMLYNRLPDVDARANFDATWAEIRRPRDVRTTQDVLRSAARAFDRKEITADVMDGIWRTVRHAETSHGRIQCTRGHFLRIEAGPVGEDTLKDWRLLDRKGRRLCVFASCKGIVRAVPLPPDSSPPDVRTMAKRKS